MELQERSPTYTSGQGSSTDADRFDIRIKLSVRDAALLWRMAAAHALAQPGLEQEDVEDIIGPMDDPSVADCLGLLLAPRAIAGCCCTDPEATHRSQDGEVPSPPKSTDAALPTVMATVTPSPTQSAEPPVPQPSGPPPQKSTRPAGVSAGKAVGPQVPPPATDASPAPPGNAEPSVSFPLANRPVERLAAETPTPVISARPSHIGRELGVEIARHIGQDEHDTLTVRLDPAHHGRIEVRMQFDDTGQLRATLTATNPATLDMLRRDSAELTRALGDAGINADAGSFRFDSAPGRGENPHASDRRDRPPRFSDPEPPPPSGPISRSIMDGGRVNLVA